MARLDQVGFTTWVVACVAHVMALMLGGAEVVEPLAPFACVLQDRSSIAAGKQRAVFCEGRNLADGIHARSRQQIVLSSHG